ncbi:MAG: SIMPL domain-containing protein [Firmicutes bacterium]|nr:SIMPL domain-containing protein [Bacillota bacterium]
MRRRANVRWLLALVLAAAAGLAAVIVGRASGHVVYQGEPAPSWTWRLEAPLPDQYLALVMDAADLELVRLAIPAPAWANHGPRLAGWLEGAQAVFVAYLGEAPTGGYGIRIRQVRVDAGLYGSVVTAVVERRSPAPGEFVTMAVTYPLDLVAVDRARLPQPPFTVRFVDGRGRLLAERHVAAPPTGPGAASESPGRGTPQPAPSGPTPAAAQQPVPGELRVTGTGEVAVAPDRATVGLAVVGRADEAPAAQADMNLQLNRVLDALQAFGLPEGAVRTRDFSLNPRWNYNDGTPQLIGYEARTRLEVDLDDLPRLGELIQALVDAGVPEVNEIRYGIKESREVLAEAMRRAAEDAQWRAEVLAGALGQRIAGIVEVQQAGQTGTQPVPISMRTAQAAGEAAPVFPPDELTVRAQVTVVYRITEL